MYEETNGLAMGSPLGPSVFNYMVHVKNKRLIINVSNISTIYYFWKNLDPIKGSKVKF